MFNLQNFIQHGFARSQFMPRPRKCRLDDLSTGPEASTKFVTKHPPIANRASSIKKLQRAARIKVGLRPLKTGVPTKRELAFQKKGK